MRKFLIVLVLFLGILFLLTRISEFEAILVTLRAGDWRYLLLAGLLQGIWLCNVAASFKAIYKAIGTDVPFTEMFVISSAVNFANIVAPVGGMSGIAVQVDYARRKGFSTGRAAIANTLYVEFDYLGFFFFLALGLIVLFRRNHLTTPALTASALLLVLAVVLGMLLYLGMRSATALEKALILMARLVNRILAPFIRRAYFSESQAKKVANEVSEGLLMLRQEPHRILAPAFLGFSSKLLMLSIFSIMFLAFDVPITSGTLVSGFSIAYLFLVISPTPAGLGFVEGALTLALSTMYLPLSTAVVITMSYRAFTFWIPFLVGLVAFRMLSVIQGKGTVEQS